jgi:hypothetical protein
VCGCDFLCPFFFCGCMSMSVCVCVCVCMYECVWMGVYMNVYGWVLLLLRVYACVYAFTLLNRLCLDPESIEGVKRVAKLKWNSLPSSFLSFAVRDPVLLLAVYQKVCRCHALIECMHIHVFVCVLLLLFVFFFFHISSHELSLSLLSLESRVYVCVCVCVDDQCSTHTDGAISW